MEYGISALGRKIDSRSSRSSRSAILIEDLYTRVQGHKLYTQHEDSEGRNREEFSHITVFEVRDSCQCLGDTKENIPQPSFQYRSL
jgi:hypothetical protein